MQSLQHIPPPAPTLKADHILAVDGTTHTYYPDGTQDVRAPDGNSWRIAPTGVVVTQWQETPAPQWQPPQSVSVSQPDGALVVHHPDGSKELWYAGRQQMSFDPIGRPIR